MIILYKLKRSERRNASIIGNRGKAVGAICEAGGIVLMLRRSEICLPLRLERK